MNPQVRLARQQILRALDGQTVQVPTSVGLLEISAKADSRWQPMRQIRPVPEHMIAHHRRMGLTPPDEVWANGEYEVQVYQAPEGEGGGTHLSIKRMDRAAIRNWRHFQQIKNEVVGAEREALELFPRESRVADNANQYHLWVMPEGLDIPVGFEGGFVTIRDQEVTAFNSAGGKGRQEPMQEGVSVGEAMQEAQDRDSSTTHADLMRKGLNRR